ncbi:(2Fe-2S)-binding protein [Chloroflexota bacterium]
MKKVHLIINGTIEDVYIEPWWTLSYVLREVLDLTGTKEGCGTGNCGSCTVIINGKAIKSCLYLAMKARDKDIITIEGIGTEDRLHPLQKAFINKFAIQCGYCTPGMIISAKALLDENPNPTEEQVKYELSGNICRCTGYVKIIEAVLDAAVEMNARRK